MEDKFMLRNGEHFRLYGDPGYANSKFILSPFKLARPGSKRAQFNKDMSALRVSVEWSFGKIVNLFAFLDFKKTQKIRLQPLGKMFVVAALLTNCHTCLNGSSTSNVFGLAPPLLEEYLQTNKV